MSKAALQRILYVDDEPDLREIVNMSLSALGGYELLLCESGKDAVAQAPSFDPQLILLDVMMPDMDGPSTLSALRALPGLDGAIFVFITAKVLETEIKRLKSLGGADVIVKPFDPMVLHERIGAIWNQAPEPSEAAGDPEIAPLVERFRTRLNDSLGELQSVRTALAEDPASVGSSMLEQLSRTCHRLAGSGGTFGFAEVSAAASRLETMIDAGLESETPMPGELAAALDRLIATIAGEISFGGA